MAGTVTALFRLAGAGFVLAREGAFSLVDTRLLPAGPRMAIGAARFLERRGAAEADRPERITRALNRLGPSYVKLGQFLATRPDIVGRDLAAVLGRLRDEIDPFPQEEARTTIARVFDRPVEALFLSFSPSVAAPSIAQVHKAEIETGEERREVAVKVLRPNVRDRFRRDLETFYVAAHLIERLDPASRRLRPVAVVETLDRSVMIEMDLRQIGRAHV